MDNRERSQILDAIPAADAPVKIDTSSADLSIFGDAARVEALLPLARKKLVTIEESATLIEVAKLLHAGTDIVVVCGSDGVASGVITKTDVIRRISTCLGDAVCTTAVSSVMSATVISCDITDMLQDVWSSMKARGIKNIPITDPEGHPIGVLSARDALAVLLQDSHYQESLLRDYVMGVGYR